MNLKDIKQKHFSKLTINTKFYNDVKRYRYQLFTKDKQVVDFMASNLFGVHRISMTDNDFEEWYRLVDIDPKRLTRDIPKLKGIEPEWNVVTHAFNFSCVMVMHLVVISDLKDEVKQDFLYELYYILAYRFFTSYYNNGFKNNLLSEDTAKALFERLSRKSLIKKLGSNWKVFEHKAHTRMDLDGIVVKRLKKPDEGIIKDTITGISGSIKGYGIAQYQVLSEMLEEESALNTQSLLNKDDEGDTVFKDVKDIHAEYYNILKNVMMLPNTLIHKDLLYLVNDIFVKTNITYVKKTLEYISEQTMKKPNEMFEYADTIVKTNVEYLYVTKMYPPYDKSLAALLKHLKNYWSSSRVKDKDVVSIKDKTVKLVAEATGARTKWVLLSTAIIVIIYLFSRPVLDKRLT